MRKYLKFGKRCLASFVTMVLSFMLISPVSVFASESVNESDIALQAAGISREEAIAMFNLTDEEAENATFYYIDDSLTGHGSMYPTDHGCTMKVLVVVI